MSRPRALAQFFTDEKGAFSSTRLVGIASGLTLCALGIRQVFAPHAVPIDTALAEALEVICVGCLLNAQIAKFAPTRTVPDA